MLKNNIVYEMKSWILEFKTPNKSILLLNHHKQMTTISVNGLVELRGFELSLDSDEISSEIGRHFGLLNEYFSAARNLTN